MLVKVHVLPKRGKADVSPLATIEGPPMYTIAMLSMKDECGASATTGARSLLDCLPIIFRWNPLTTKMLRISLAHMKRTVLPKRSQNMIYNYC